MVEEVKQPTPEVSKPSKPDWLGELDPQAELVKIWNDVFETDCNCEICTRLRKALSKVKPRQMPRITPQ